MFDISSASIHGLMPLKLHEATFADFLAFLRFLTHILNFMTVLVSHGPRLHLFPRDPGKDAVQGPEKTVRGT